MPTLVKLSRSAEADLQALLAYGLAQFGTAQAAGYAARLSQALDTISQFPESFPLEPMLSPPQRVAPVGQHIILYEYDGTAAFVTRIRHHAEDWRV